MNHSPFLLQHTTAYQRWRDQKLAHWPADKASLLTELDGPQPAAHTIQRLKATVRQHNMAFYRFPAPEQIGRPEVHALATRMGLIHLHANLCADPDSLSAIQVTRHENQHDYIPYTDRQLSWHTDGYYQAPAEQIHGMLLHCVRPARQGGESRFMDHEIAYILLREADPAFITALMHPQTLTIPANILHGKIIRPRQHGPVFSINPDGSLHMRYSARQKNILWRRDPATQAAAAFLLQLWEQDSPWKVQYRLQAGEGVLCNNVLHCRSGFVDHDEPQQGRLLYRGRYTDRVGQDHPAPPPSFKALS
ncbi:MAG TPA: TauD/TfdA family dioxygenase [Thiolinea sp.]|nr:TauD/TfdA family dioxygenase [Thiolinea sp.]